MFKIFKKSIKMKFFAVFAAVLALGSAAYSPYSDPVVLSLPQTTTLSLDELATAIHDPLTNPAVLPYLEGGLNDLMAAIFAGQDQTSITVHIPAMVVHMWHLKDVEAAIMNPETDPELNIYLEHAFNMAMFDLFSGIPVTYIPVITPPGVIAVAPVQPVAPVNPKPPVNPVVNPVAPVNPAPVVVPEAPQQASPLVQIIINVNAQSAGSPTPTPVAVAEAAEEDHFIPVSPGQTPAVDTDGPIIAVGPWA